MPIDNSKRPRGVLKTYFTKNAIPTEAQFGELIDGGLNQRDDGIQRIAGDALGIEAAGDAAGLKRTVAFWSSFADQNPAYTIALRARRTAADPQSARDGWNLLDSAGTPRLTVDTATGNVGVGTIQPRERLDVDGRVAAGLLTMGPWAPDGTYAAIGVNTLDQNSRHSFALLQHREGATFLNSPVALYLQYRNSDRVVISDGEVAVTRPLRVGSLSMGPWPVNPAFLHIGLNTLDQRQAGNYALLVGETAERGVTFVNSPTKVNLRVANNDRVIVEDQAVTVTRALMVAGSLVPSAGTGAGAGINFPPNPGGGGGDGAWMRYYARAGEATTLEIGVSNDPDDHLALMPSGNVGIGVLDPGAKLDVGGDAVVRGALRVATVGTAAGQVTFPGAVQFQNDIAIGGKHAIRGNDGWLRLNQEKHFANGVHVPGLFAPMSINVGAAGGWVDPGPGNISYAGQLSKLEVMPGHAAVLNCCDLIMGGSRTPGRRPTGGRAVIDLGDKLIFNYAGDWPTTELHGRVIVPGVLTPSAGAGDNGIIFPRDPNGGGGDVAWIKYFSRGSESMTLEIGIQNDADDHIALNPSGNVGIGTNNPGVKLDVAGAVRCIGFYNSSSRTLKKKIRPLDSARAASLVASLDPVSFEWKEGDAPEQLGFIAEDCPEAIATEKRDAISITPIIAALTRVVRDQTATIAALTDRLGRLEARA